MDREKAKAISDKIAVALAPMAQEEGLTLRVLGGKFGASYVNIKVEVSEANGAAPPGAPTGKDAETFLKWAPEYGLSPDDLGRPFVSHTGTLYRIVGLRLKATKYPIIARHVENGRRYKFRASEVKAGLERKDGGADETN
ncbi:MAG: hypothetical protein ACYTAN_17935 [Planctomycetota bacterium]|jgi:hypothetical protein